MNLLKRNRIEDSARTILGKIPGKKRAATAIFYVGAVILGILSGFSESVFLRDLMDFIATVFTRLFSFIAVPIIALALNAPDFPSICAQALHHIRRCPCASIRQPRRRI